MQVGNTPALNPLNSLDFHRTAAPEAKGAQSAATATPPPPPARPTATDADGDHDGSKGQVGGHIDVTA
jgi:hypothetical protein